jgi:hypothetical protein
MYGFHKINRTPRAQRTSSDAQTWEFSHHKFLRGRPDLLDEIKRKALEPDPAVKHRVELPGEVSVCDFLFDLSSSFLSATSPGIISAALRSFSVPFCIGTPMLSACSCAYRFVVVAEKTEEMKLYVQL